MTSLVAVVNAAVQAIPPPPTTRWLTDHWASVVEAFSTVVLAWFAWLQLHRDAARRADDRKALVAHVRVTAHLLVSQLIGWLPGEVVTAPALRLANWIVYSDAEIIQREILLASSRVADISVRAAALSLDQRSRASEAVGAVLVAIPVLQDLRRRVRPRVGVGGFAREHQAKCESAAANIYQAISDLYDLAGVYPTFPTAKVHVEIENHVGDPTALQPDIVPLPPDAAT